jgi:hypothetical protein
VIKVKVSGSFKNTEAFLFRMKNQEQFKALNKFGSIGVSALSSATPKESGETANSWSYKIIQKPGYYSIVWLNSYIEDGIPIAVILQYGHGTGTGGYVQGRDYINPAIQPIFDKIIADMWKVVTQ